MANSFAMWASFRGAPDTLRGPEPWTANPAGRPIGWVFGSQTARYLIYGDPQGFDALATPGITFARSAAESFGFHAVMPKATADLFLDKSAPGFPAMAKYGGRGDVNSAVNWTCPADDRRLLELGHAGRKVGVGDPE